MTQEDNYKERFEQYEKDMVKIVDEETNLFTKDIVQKIKKVRQQTLKKFLIYCCLDYGNPINIKSRRAKYDYKLAKEIIDQSLEFASKMSEFKQNYKLNREIEYLKSVDPEGLI